MASTGRTTQPQSNLANRDASSGSQTATSTHADGAEQGDHLPPLQPVLRLRGASISTPQPPRRRQPAIRWADDVVDNEGLGRKSSKVCCIYHAPRGIDESSDESSSDSSSSSDDSESDSDMDRARPVGNRRARRPAHSHDHDHDGDCDHDQTINAKGKTGDKRGKKKRERSPNAYEKIPKPKMKGKGGSVTMTMGEQ